MSNTDEVEFGGIRVHPCVRFIHTKLKDFFVKGLSTLLKTIPEYKKIDSYSKIESLDLQRQW